MKPLSGILVVLGRAFLASFVAVFLLSLYFVLVLDLKDLLHFQCSIFVWAFVLSLAFQLRERIGRLGASILAAVAGGVSGLLLAHLLSFQHKELAIGIGIVVSVLIFLCPPSGVTGIGDIGDRSDTTDTS